MAGGRPTDYNADVATRICSWLAEGKSLRAFCRQDDAPGLSTVTMWIVTHPEFRAQYVRAREAAGYAHADNIVDVAQEVRDGGIDPQAGRVAMDGLKWAAERMAPKTHSPKQEIDHTSSDGSMKPPTRIEIVAGGNSKD